MKNIGTYTTLCIGFKKRLNPVIFYDYTCNGLEGPLQLECRELEWQGAWRAIKVIRFIARGR